MEKRKIDLLEDKSEITRELIGKMPHWLVRWGLSVFFIFIVIFIGLLYIVRFPDTIEAPVTLTSGNPSISLIAESDGKVSLLIEDKKQVRRNAIIAVIENPARTKDVFDLKMRIQDFKSSLASAQVDLGMEWPDSLVLGPLQYEYAEFSKLYKEYVSYRTLDPINKVLSISRERLTAYMDLKKNIKYLEDIEQKRSTIAAKNHDRNTALLKEKVIAPSQFEESEASYLEALQLAELKKTEINAVEIKTKELQSFIVEQELLSIQREQNYTNNLRSLSNKIESMISAWEHDYVLRSPIDGTINFLNFWADHLYVKKGEQVGVVTPNHVKTIFAKAQVAPMYSGKIKEGQKVRIKLKNFPYHEFGMIVGRVSTISSVANSNSIYFVDVELPQKLVSTYKISIPYQSDLVGVAEIELEDMSLLGRIFYQFKSTFTHSLKD